MTTTNTNHPLMGAIDDFLQHARSSLPLWRQEERDTIERSGVSAMRSIAIAATGTRRKFHLERACEGVAKMRAVINVLWIRRAIEFSFCDEAYRRLDRILEGLRRLPKADDQPWSGVELPKLAPPSVIELPLNRPKKPN